MPIRPTIIWAGMLLLNLGAASVAFSSSICEPVESGEWWSPDPAVQNAFGLSVSIDGNTAAIGMPYDDDGGLNAGAVWLFHREPDSTWVPLKKLAASDASAGAVLSTVSISGSTVLVGAHESSSGVPFHGGAAYVFEQNFGGPDNWGEVRKLIPSDASDEQHFGVFLSISGDIALVAAPGGHSYSGAGAAYIFERDLGGTNNWGERVKLTAPPGVSETAFGWSVAVDGDTAVVCDFQADALGTEAGACYVYYRHQDGTDAWGYVRTLMASDGSENDLFGHSVDVSGDSIVVGAVAAYEWPPNPGAAYIFDRNEGGADNWGEVRKLIASDAGTIPEFGRAVAIDGSLVVVGATRDNFVTEGAAYVFHRNHGGTNSWGEVARIQGGDSIAGDKFGSYVALSGDTALVGSPFHDHAGLDAGAVYQINIPPDADDDSIADDCDNCPVLANPDQSDTDSDGFGDACDACTGHDDNLDCNSNGAPDGCDIAHDCCDTAHGSGCSLNSIEACVCEMDRYCCLVEWDDLCVQLVTDGTCGSCDIDCNVNGVPDECDIASGTSQDCQPDATPDECQLADNDCDTNGVPDDCQPDFDGDGVIDGPFDYPCDDDIDGDGVPNEEDVCDYTPPGHTPVLDPQSCLYGTLRGDYDGDCDVDLFDYAQFAGQMTAPNPPLQGVP